MAQTVKELIEELQQCPPDAEIAFASNPCDDELVYKGYDPRTDKVWFGP